ncbi:MAG: hypothetical protein HQK58_00195 [Deltaproteobacteria bacterium]|nr:hypothetical protein [Deltaproteobacteria bacterium]
MTGAAIHRSGIKDKLWEQSSQSGGLIGVRIYLFGRAWHLAEYHPRIAHKGKPKTRYIPEIIKKDICDLFNDSVRPEIFGVDFPRLENINIDIAGEPETSKLACSLGSISPRNVVAIGDGIHNDPTFLGLSYTDSEEQRVDWFQHLGENPIPYPENVDQSALSPSMVITSTELANLFANKFNEMSLGDPLKRGRVARNFVEYLLECQIGGYRGHIKGITLNAGMIPDPKK